MTKTQLWCPDTCGCQIEEKFDDATGIITYFSTVSACEVHAPLADTPAHYDTVLAENRGKNFAMTAAMELLPELTEVVSTEDGQVTKFKTGFHPSYTFDAERKLVLRVKVDDAAALAF